MRAVALARAALALLAALTGGCGKESKERVVDLGGGVKMTFVLVPAGTFTMGSTDAEIKAVLAKWPEIKEEFFADEKPAHKTTLSKAFWMGKHEVTVGQFRKFVDAAGYKTDAEKGTGYKVQFVFADGEADLVKDASWRNPYCKQTDEHPVVLVSWNDARAFVNWLNATDKAKPAGSTYRLPTEAEWEYACRGGTTTWYQWGDDADKGKGWCNATDLTAKKTLPGVSVDNLPMSWFKWDDGFLYTAPVGSFKANAFGLHDMHGNVSEWCEDWYGPYKEGDQADPGGAASGKSRVVRDGSWIAGRPPNLRSAARSPFLPYCRDGSVGVRVVLAPGP
ncbi:MAG TPA: formylglycine-generating enzyme family protein [Planctomycetota bacterium]|nr:formylglycine-generating enzyme family protein [Planctomycetota bacterium]